MLSSSIHVREVFSGEVEEALVIGARHGHLHSRSAPRSLFAKLQTWLLAVFTCRKLDGSKERNEDEALA